MFDAAGNPAVNAGFLERPSAPDPTRKIPPDVIGIRARMALEFCSLPVIPELACVVPWFVTLQSKPGDPEARPVTGPSH